MVPIFADAVLAPDILMIPFFLKHLNPEVTTMGALIQDFYILLFSSTNNCSL
jgi:hypothetical protein